MKKDTKNKENSTSDLKNVSQFYKDNKKIINGLGIAAVAGLAVYSIVKWLPFEEIVSKIEKKYDEQFSDREFSHPVGQEV